MMTKSTEESLQEVVKYLLEINPERTTVPDETLDLVEAGWLDSLQTMGLIVLIEQLRGAPIEMEMMSIDHLRSLQTIRTNFFECVCP